MSDFEDSYLGQLRKLVGNRRLITPTVGAIVQDAEERILLIQRSDKGNGAFLPVAWSLMYTAHR